ncbi:hypothetical protein K437DRAFT_192710 [Tilletiaria anomala UBC 951]|uniref:SUZ domain-containing protein n=1 Tax=Tilletiaria anomala (strain ATCC 24038 / CBS 436.72 / UBC 951) TaxID=1037660 RepID=A0A066VMM2_TILAU|nr:uncharacterized protein K437DRAFT_192710 [Tilletiaria anomala UBC 951]KDN40014.1 hypothetical protein K437DRAFT_192710 [Tilletiaria anomala UBC 951]
MVLTKRIQIKQKAKAPDAVVDDWDAESLGGERGDGTADQGAQQASATEASSENLGKADIGTSKEGTTLESSKDYPGPRALVLDDYSRSIWEKANASGPASPQGVILLRPSDAAVGGSPTLPTAALAQTNSIAEGGVPKILRRSPASGAGSGVSSSSSSARASSTAMTLEQREKAYAEARARIFGTTSELGAAYSSSPTSSTSPAASEASGSSEAVKGSGRSAVEGPTRRRGVKGQQQQRGGRGGGGSGRNSPNAHANANQGREAPPRSSTRSSPSNTPSISRASDMSNSSEQPRPPTNRFKVSDGTRQPRGPQDGSAGFLAR